MSDDIISDLPRSRKEAKLQNVKYYFTGLPCKNGHIFCRFTSDRSCKKCKAVSTLSWKINNINLVRERDRKFAKNNKKKRNEYLKIWSKLNRKKLRLQEKVSRQRRRIADGKFNKNDILIILNRQKLKCATCKCDISDKYHVDHIMPIFLGGTHFPKNLQILCPSCNLKKNKKHPNDWARENGLLI